MRNMKQNTYMIQRKLVDALVGVQAREDLSDLRDGRAGDLSLWDWFCPGGGGGPEDRAKGPAGSLLTHPAGEQTKERGQ